MRHDIQDLMRNALFGFHLKGLPLLRPPEGPRDVQGLNEEASFVKGSIWLDECVVVYYIL